MPALTAALLGSATLASTALASSASGTRGTPPVTAMRVLRHLVLPGVDHSSGSIAFDGQAIYYGPRPISGGSAPGPESTVFRRVDVHTGRALTPVDIPLRGVTALNVDLRRGTLLAQVYAPAYTPTLPTTPAVPARAGVWEVDPAAGTARELFSLDPAHASDQRIGYDSLTGHFVQVANEDNELVVRSRTGATLSHCTLPIGTSGQGAASLVSAGDGELFVQDEDDETIFRVDESCRLRDIGYHTLYGESSGENDQLACDTVTFRQPAIWLRDITSDSHDGATAYAVAQGHCPLPTRTSLLPPRPGMVGRPMALCATVKLAATQRALGALPIQLRTATSPLPAGVTDGTGRGCVQWRPTVPGKVRLRAAFVGDRSYLPSSAVGLVTVLPAPHVTVAVPPRGAAAPPVAPPQQPPAPAPNVQVGPAGNPQVQPQPAPQPAPQGQPMAVVVPQMQPQVQVQVQSVPQSRGLLEQAMSRRSPPIGALQIGGGLLVLTLVVAFGLSTAPRTARVSSRPGGRR